MQMRKIISFDWPNEFIGDRIILRIPEATFENAEKIFKLIDQNREHIRKGLAFPIKITRKEDTFQWLEHVQKAFKEQSKGEYGMYERSTGQLYGICTMVRLYDFSYEIQYWLAEDKCGHGYMSEAVSLLEKFLFKNGVIRIQIRNEVQNVASGNIPKRLGYHLDGVLRQSHYSHYLNAYMDVNMWSKTKDEFEKEK